MRFKCGHTPNCNIHNQTKLKLSSQLDQSNSNKGGPFPLKLWHVMDVTKMKLIILNFDWDVKA